MKIKDNIANEFDAFSANYTNDMIGCVPYYLELLSHFADSFSDEFHPKNILDVGCGNGIVTSKLIPKFPKARYTLLDASREMLSLCQEQFKNYNINYVESYFQDFIFKEDHFDLVVAGFSLHHCDSKEKKELFEKIYNTLKTGGIFLCSDLMISKKNPEHPVLKQQWKKFVHKTFPEGEKWEWLMEHYDEFDKPDNLKDQISWLEKTGFNTIDLKVYENYWTHFRATKN